MRFVLLLCALIPFFAIAACEAQPEPTSEPAPATAVAPEPAVEPSPVVIGTAPGRDAPADPVVVSDLTLGVPGAYTNLTYGYQLRYPENWFTGFGNRPILASFSDLDPGLHNRDSMRAGGCLVEVSTSTNVFDLSLVDVVAQMPRSFPDAELFSLDDAPAVRSRRSADDGAGGERVQVAHGDQLFNLTLDHAPDAAERCGEAWQTLLDSWTWIEPQLTVYRNPERGFAVSYPNSFSSLSESEDGLQVSSEVPAEGEGATALSRRGMVLSTQFFANESNLPLKEWLAANTDGAGRTNDIPLDTLIGVRTMREGAELGTQEMVGTYQGPEGNIIVVTCAYPLDRQWEFRPIANAVLYSFNF